MKRKTRVVATGVFDLLHIGHLRFLEEAKRLGDELIVVVSCDSVVAKEKRMPINSQESRRKLVEALVSVDKAIIAQDLVDKFKILVQLKPDILVLGHDQSYDPDEVEKELKARGCKTRVVRLEKYSNQSTSKIIGKIKGYN